EVCPREVRIAGGRRESFERGWNFVVDRGREIVLCPVHAIEVHTVVPPGPWLSFETCPQHQLPGMIAYGLTQERPLRASAAGREPGALVIHIAPGEIQNLVPPYAKAAVKRHRSQRVGVVLYLLPHVKPGTAGRILQRLPDARDIGFSLLAQE